jgi:hypothetical protein
MLTPTLVGPLCIPTLLWLTKWAEWRLTFWAARKAGNAFARLAKTGSTKMDQTTLLLWSAIFLVVLIYLSFAFAFVLFVVPF